MKDTNKDTTTRCLRLKSWLSTTGYRRRPRRPLWRSSCRTSTTIHQDSWRTIGQFCRSTRRPRKSSRFSPPTTMTDLEATGLRSLSGWILTRTMSSEPVSKSKATTVSIGLIDQVDSYTQDIPNREKNLKVFSAFGFRQELSFRLNYRSSEMINTRNEYGVLVHVHRSLCRGSERRRNGRGIVPAILRQGTTKGIPHSYRHQGFR